MLNNLRREDDERIMPGEPLWFEVEYHPLDLPLPCQVLKQRKSIGPYTNGRVNAPLVDNPNIDTRFRQRIGGH